MSTSALGPGRKLRPGKSWWGMFLAGCAFALQVRLGGYGFGLTLIVHWCAGVKSKGQCLHQASWMWVLLFLVWGGALARMVYSFGRGFQAKCVGCLAVSKDRGSKLCWFSWFGIGTFGWSVGEMDHCSVAEKYHCSIVESDHCCIVQSQNHVSTKVWTHNFQGHHTKNMLTASKTDPTFISYARRQSVNYKCNSQ